MSYVIGCDSFLSLRNVRNGQLGRHLDDVRVWVAQDQMPGSLLAAPEGVQIEPLEEFAARKGTPLWTTLTTAYDARKAYYDGWTFWNERLFSVSKIHQKSAVKRAGSLAVNAARTARSWSQGARGGAQSGRRASMEALRREPLVAEYIRRFEENRPDAVAVLSLEGNREMLLAEAAHKAGIPVAVLIRSRDNLAAKILHLPDAAAYFVWSQATKEFFHRMYPEIPHERVLVTGSPQFDRHFDTSCRLGREEYFAAMGLDSSRPLVVYTMATPGLIKHEGDIVQHLADAAHEGKLTGGAQLLVRGHPRMFGSDWPILRQEWPEAKAFPRPVAAPYKSEAHEAEVVRLLLEDEPVHLATLAYQDVQVNVCGTMTIDSAILDKPVVNVYYDGVKVAPGLSVRRFYERSDVKDMMAYGASRLAHSPEECIKLINGYLADPSQDAAGRRRAREEDCGPLDGRAGERIAGHLRRIAGKEAVPTLL